MIQKQWNDKVLSQFLFLFSSSNEDYFIVKLSYASSLLDENRKRNLIKTLSFQKQLDFCITRFLINVYNSFN